MSKKLISIVIPVYNEEKNIPIIYHELKSVIKHIDYSFELLFVNDGSTDSTSCSLKKYPQII